MRNIIIASVSLFGLLIGSAYAETTLTYTSTSFPKDEIVTLNDSSLGVNNESVYAGGFTLGGLSGNATAISALTSDPAWCVDITHEFITSGSTYIVGQSPSVAGLTNTATINTVANLINDFENNFAPSDKDSAATQIAIWEAVYGGKLQVSGNYALTQEAANLLSTAESEGSLPSGDQLDILARGTTFNQDLAYLVIPTSGNGGGSSNVPEPASMALLGVGFAGVVAARRRKTV